MGLGLEDDFVDAGALAADVEAVLGIGHADTLKVEVFYRSVGVIDIGSDVFNAREDGLGEVIAGGEDCPARGFGGRDAVEEVEDVVASGGEVERPGFAVVGRDLTRGDATARDDIVLSVGEAADEGLGVVFAEEHADVGVHHVAKDIDVFGLCGIGDDRQVSGQTCFGNSRGFVPIVRAAVAGCKPRPGGGVEFDDEAFADSTLFGCHEFFGVIGVGEFQIVLATEVESVVGGSDISALQSIFAGNLFAFETFGPFYVKIAVGAKE